MTNLKLTDQELHHETMSIAADMKRKEAEILPRLMEMSRRRLFSKLEYTGIYDYVTRCLKLSSAQAEYYRRVAEKAQEVPQLKAAVSEGKLSLSQARRIVSVIDDSNADDWIEKADKLPQRELERAVSEVNPNAIIRERIRPVAKERLELRAGISPAVEAKLKRVQDLLGTSSIEQALEASLDAYLEKHDPVRKAERAALRKAKPPAPPSSGRKKLRAQVEHEVTLRDADQCTHRYPDGSRCPNRRFLHKHHVVHVAHGGLNVADNIATLCSAHHRARHVAAPFVSRGPG